MTKLGVGGPFSHLNIKRKLREEGTVLYSTQIRPIGYYKQSKSTNGNTDRRFSLRVRVQQYENK